MSYYEDLTAYEYCRRHEPEDVHAVNVGWLSCEHPYAQGATSREFQERLLRLCHDGHVVHVARGFHTCDLCGVSSAQWYREGKERYGPNTQWAGIGDGEIRVFGKDATFAAPALIYHYVLDHSYLPPAAFIEAVLTGPQADTAEYRALLARWLRL